MKPVPMPAYRFSKPIRVSESAGLNGKRRSPRH